MPTAPALLHDWRCPDGTRGAACGGASQRGGPV